MDEIADVIICPHCKHPHDFTDYTEGNISGFLEIECDKCGKEFNVDFYSIFYFTTNKPKGV